MENDMNEKLFHWELMYDPQADQLRLLCVPIDAMTDGFATIAGETVPAKQLCLYPEEAKSKCIELIERGMENLKKKSEKQRALYDTAKSFPVLQAAQARLDQDAKENDDAPAIVSPQGKRLN